LLLVIRPARPTLAEVPLADLSFFVGGDVVVVPFPFTDLQSSKRRPAVVLATFARGDLLICQITSRSESHPTAVAIGTDDFLRGGIDRPSVALPHRLVTVHEAVILRSAGTLAPSKLAELVERVCAVIRAGGDA
jgi:mRNA interferase MazF